MKFFQYYDENDNIRVGAVTPEGHKALPETVRMEDLLSGCREKTEQTAAVDGRILNEADIRFAPVVSSPEKILCIGLNYNEHISETGLEDEAKPGFPPVFCKFTNALIGHRAPLRLPLKAEQFDYEAELVIIIGKECRGVSREQASEYIAGYTAGNDFSARDMQFASGQWTMGKACDDFAPVGPYFVPAEEVDPGNLEIICKVNGNVVQHSSTSRMIYSCAEIVSYLSDFITLKKGDLIFTGTPSGVILGKDPDSRNWLKAGDVVTVEIEGLGVLENNLIL